MNFPLSNSVARSRSLFNQFEQSFKTLQNTEIKDGDIYADFLHQIRATLVHSHKFAGILASDPEFKTTDMETLNELMMDYYQILSLDPDDSCNIPYDTCLANPEFAVKKYVKPMGQLLSTIYLLFRNSRSSHIQRNYQFLCSLNDLFLKMMADHDSGKVSYDLWLNHYKDFQYDNLEPNTHFNMYWHYAEENTYFKDIVMNADLHDLRYLHRYGVYLSRYDREMAGFMNNYPEQELESLAKYIVKSFIDGFIRGDRDYKIKEFATLVIPCGMERLGRMVIRETEALGLKVLVPQPITNGINKQAVYDHRFDNALYLSSDYVDKAIKIYSDTMDSISGIIGSQAGSIYVELFGEKPFSPVAKDSVLKLSDEQLQLSRRQNGTSSQIYFKHAKSHESSFCIIAFPSTEIGDNFGDIFADTIKINLLDSDVYARIQQHIIDVLDRADYVHVKGKNGNETDIMVKMHKLKDPDKETLFENCVADVNIPVGEVFTSPLLTGTNGTLHVEDIYLGNLRYFDIKLRFKDGWIEDYGCSNFESEEENRNYVSENLLVPHKSLPIGEFAIGTNTTAYQIAKKYDILSLLPILIIEKMGPHFAIGDTCFSHEEDIPHLSFVNGKNMIAVENEKSATRNDDPMNAYLQKHMDITLPYEMLESITAILHNGERVDIIRDGLFVVPGTEELNVPLLEMRN